MKKNGFITSALLYGMLALFLTLMLGSLAILANRKLSMDSLREAALEDVSSASGISGFYNIWRAGSTYTIEGYANDAGFHGIWTTNSDTPVISMNTDSYKNIAGIYLSLGEEVTEDMKVTIEYSETDVFTPDKKMNGTLTSGSKSIAFSIKKGNYTHFKITIGNKAGLVYRINEISLIVQA